MTDLSVQVAERLTRIETLIEQMNANIKRVFDEFKSVEDRFRQQEIKLEAKFSDFEKRLRVLEDLRSHWGGVAAVFAFVWPIVVAFALKIFFK